MVSAYSAWNDGWVGVWDVSANYPSGINMGDFYNLFNVFMIKFME